MRVLRVVHYAALSAMLFGGVAAASAQDLPAEEMIKNRIANFREIGTAYKGIGDELKGSDPYIPAVQESARQIESLGSEILSWFPEGTGPAPKEELGIIDTILSWFSDEEQPSEGETKAKPAIWAQWPTFEQRQRKFHAEAKKMTEVAQAGDKEAIAAQYKVLGNTCKGCHDTFREPTDE